MRICILAKHLPPNSTDGIPRNRWLYAKLFHKYGWDVHVITNGVAGCEDYRDGIYIHEIDPKEYDIKETVIDRLVDKADDRYRLEYSYAAYKRIRKLNQSFPIDLIDQSLWELEGLITKIKLPAIPMLTRVDTTSRLIQEINFPDRENEFTVLNELEQFTLLNTDALVFNSWSILKETQRLYEINLEGRPYAVVHHGINLHLNKTITRSVESTGKFKILVPGRLEKRKGTTLLLRSVLPKLLSEKNNFEIHFVGKDNSDWDGFKAEFGVSYSEFIKQKFGKEVGNRLFLHGHVGDEELNEHYETADCVLIPSLYESFGLTYLEALSFGKPVVALRSGAVNELFEHDKEILLASPDNAAEICAFISKLSRDPDYAHFLVHNAQKKLESHYTADIMASRCILFIEDILRNKPDSIVYQVMNSLTEGDGISGFTRDYDYLFKTNGQLTQIIGNHSSSSLSYLTKQIHEFRFHENDTLLYHYGGHCEWAEYINSVNSPRKVLFFHNITPPHFFQKDGPEYLSVKNGLAQVIRLDNFDLYVALSQYSLNILQQLIPKKLNTSIIPQLIDKDIILSKPFSKELVIKLRQQYKFHIIFVGRVVPHKKQADLIRFAHYYKTHFGNHFHMSIIGGGMPAYLKELELLTKKFSLEDNISITGKLPDEDLYAYYRGADCYLSMSEHEGFGTPLAESMIFEIPVIAYGVTAVPETIGDNGCIFYEKNFELVAHILNQVRTHQEFRNSVIDKQNEQLKKYSRESVTKALQQMQDTCDQLHAQRRNALINQNKLFNEEFLNLKDPRFIKRGEWSVADGRTLIHYGHDKDSNLELHSSFFEADVFIVNNSHSGKVALYLDNKQILVADLFAPQWSVTKYSVAGNGAAIQSLKIVPLSEKNDQSTGKEVLVYGVRLKQPYSLKVGLLYQGSKEILPRPLPSQEFKDHLQ